MIQYTYCVLAALTLQSIADVKIGCAENRIAHPLLVGAFNIRVFGKSKMQKPEVVENLVKIIRRYDLIVIQEIRDIKQVAFPTLMSKVNGFQSASASYGYIVSPRLGKTSMKEQYGFVFRLNVLEPVRQYSYVDKDGVFERPPYIVTFRRTTTTGVQDSFNFIPLHAKPSAAVTELSALHLVYEDAINKTGIRDAVIAGDFNADCSYVCKSCWGKIRLRSMSGSQWLIEDGHDTTVYSTDCAYDRIVVTGSMTATGFGGKVFSFDSEFGLTTTQAKAISDHYPVEFTII